MALGISYAVLVSGKVLFTSSVAICLGVRPAAGWLNRRRVPPSPAIRSAVTPSAAVVTLYAEPSEGYETENAPSAEVNRGLAVTGSPIGGRPQSGGQT